MLVNKGEQGPDQDKAGTDPEHLDAQGNGFGFQEGAAEEVHSPLDFMDFGGEGR